MNNVLVAFNLIGIIVLCALCSIQWKVNSQLNLRANALEATRQQQLSKLGDDGKIIKSYVSDLDDFHQRLSLSETQLKDLDDKLVHELAERNQVAAQRDDLKIALGKWTAAVADRDRLIELARDQLQKLAADRNDAVQKLNGLTDKYNLLVKQWNDQQAKH